MTTPSGDAPRTAQFFTAVRRLPLLIGKLGETRLFGGPYTVVQILSGLGVLIIGYITMPLWGPLLGGNPIVRLVALVAAAAGVLFFSGQIPATRRKPHHILVDLIGVMSASADGTVDGKVIRLPQPRAYVGTVYLAEADELPAADATPALTPGPAQAPATTPEPTMASSANPSPAPKFATGLDRLIQQAHREDH